MTDHVVKFAFDISTLKIENMKLIWNTSLWLFSITQFWWLNCVNNLFGQLDFGTILAVIKQFLVTFHHRTYSTLANTSATLAVPIWI